MRSSSQRCAQLGGGGEEADQRPSGAEVVGRYDSGAVGLQLRGAGRGQLLGGGDPVRGQAERRADRRHVADETAPPHPFEERAGRPVERARERPRGDERGGHGPGRAERRCVQRDHRDRRPPGRRAARCPRRGCRPRPRRPRPRRARCRGTSAAKCSWLIALRRWVKARTLPDASHRRPSGDSMKACVSMANGRLSMPARSPSGTRLGETPRTTSCPRAFSSSASTVRGWASPRVPAVTSATRIWCSSGPGLVRPTVPHDRPPSVSEATQRIPESTPLTSRAPPQVRRWSADALPERQPVGVRVVLGRRPVGGEHAAWCGWPCRTGPSPGRRR